MDLPVLDRIIAEEVTGPFEGRHLHAEVPAFAAVPPTCEAIAREVYRRISGRLPQEMAALERPGDFLGDDPIEDRQVHHRSLAVAEGP